jgi:hypothetical protein
MLALALQPAFVALKTRGCQQRQAIIMVAAQRSTSTPEEYLT